MKDYILKYVKQALSKENRKEFDGDSNAKFRVCIELCEVGTDVEEKVFRHPVTGEIIGGDDEEDSRPVEGDETGNFYFQIKIPRQVDNCLGGTLTEQVYTRKEAIAILEEVIAELKSSGNG